MVFACCFGGGGDRVLVQQRLQVYGTTVDPSITGKTGKTQDFTELASGAANKNGTTFLTGNTTSLSAVTNTDNSSAAYHLSILNAALAGLSGNWYERVALAASRLISTSGAVLCSVSILDGAHDRFTIVHVTGKQADCATICPEGSSLPALRAVVPSAHLSVPSAGVGLRYNSAQVLQLLQTPLLYSFSDPAHASKETSQPPHDWQTIHNMHGLSDFCALPLIHDKAVVGAVTLIFSTPAPAPRDHPQQQQQQLLGSRGGPHPCGAAPTRLGISAPAATLMSCDEQSLRTAGLLLSALLVGQDMHLAHQIADIFAGVYDARNLQQTITVITAGAEQVLQLTTRVVVATNLAMITMPFGPQTSGPSSLPAATAAAGPSAAAAGSATLGVAGGSGSCPVGAGGRAIFFEERGGSGAVLGGSLRADGGGHGPVTSGSRSLPVIMGDTGGSGLGLNGAVHGAGYRSRLQRSATPDGNAASAPPGSHSLPTAGVSHRLRVWPGAAGQSLTRSNGAACMSQESAATGGSNAGVLLQAGMVQARALGLRHTLLANLPSTGTIVQDCASYIQQVGCPKRDLYLLSTCQGAPPFSLVIVPAPLKEGDPTRLVLYVAVAVKLPFELLSEILSQAHVLAMRVLAPLLQQKLLHGDLADEWTLLQGCAVGRGGAGAGANDMTSAPDLRASNCAMSDKDAYGGVIDAGGSLAGGGSVATSGAADIGGAGGGTGSGAQRLWCPQLPAGPPGPAGTLSDTMPPSESARTGTSAQPSDVNLGHRTLSPGPGALPGGSATVLSTAVGGVFAGDTRTHMGMLVSSFKDTINALQAIRADEAEELSVLKLGKVLGRGGSGLVFQGYLHMGLEVAVKLFENPDDTEPDAVSADEAPNTAGSHQTDGGGCSPGSAGPDASSADAAAAAATGGSTVVGSKDAASAARTAGNGGSIKDKEKDKERPGTSGGGGGVAGGSKDASSTPQQQAQQQQQPARRNSLKSTAQMTKRQRDLLRNALELGVTSSLSHPNIVQGYCHWVNVVLMQDASLNRCWLMGQAEYMALAPPGSPPPPLCSALVMEYCDMGSLIHALKRGAFNATDNKPNMEFVYMCLLEIALALRHLHTAKLAHCDLKPGNVFLRSSPRDPRGFVCKLGDFGYAAILKDGLLPGRPAVLPDEACGTLQYMAPELFVAGRPVDASIDIYAFGMLMWELITGKTPYSDNEYGSRALMKAVYHGKRPAFPDSTLPAYKNLAMCCWSGDPNLRPSASVLVKLLRQQLESLKQQHPASSVPSTTAGTKA